MGIFDFAANEAAQTRNGDDRNDDESVVAESLNEDDIFLFESDDESVSELRERIPKRRRRDDSLLTKIRYRFGKGRGLDEEEPQINTEIGSTETTQPTQIRTVGDESDSGIKNPESGAADELSSRSKEIISEEYDSKQPTQMDHIAAAVNPTQPTQLKPVSAVFNATQPTQMKSDVNSIHLKSVVDSENPTQPTQMKPVVDSINLTQPTQMKPIMDSINLTQPTQMKSDIAEAAGVTNHTTIMNADKSDEKEVAGKASFPQQNTSLGENSEAGSGVFTQPTQLNVGPNHQPTQATQLKLHPVLDTEQSNPVFKQSDQYFTQPTQLQHLSEEQSDNFFSSDDNADSPLKEPTAQLGPAFEESEKEDEDPFLPRRKPTQITQLQPIFDDSDGDDDAIILPTQRKQSLEITEKVDKVDKFDKIASVGSSPGSQPFESKSSFSGKPASKEIDLLAIDDYDSDISEYEIDLEPIKEAIMHNQKPDNSVPPTDKELHSKINDSSVSIKAVTLKKVPSTDVITFTSSDDEDSDIDTVSEKGATKATTLIIKAHLAQRKYKNNQANGFEKRKKNRSLDTESLVNKLKKEAARQSKGARIDVSSVDRLYDEVMNAKADTLPITETIEVTENTVLTEVSASVELHIGNDDILSEEDVSEAASEEIMEKIGYGKEKKELLNPSEEPEPESEVIKTHPADEKSIEPDESEGDSEFSHASVKESTSKRKLLKDQPTEQFNPFVAEEAEESDEDDDLLIAKKATDNQEEYYDNEVHTSDEEMVDDDSDVDDNEEMLRDLKREQLALDEERLEKQIQQTLKGKKRGDRDEFDDDDGDEYDLEDDDEYLAYKRKQALIDEQVAKRMSKSSKNKINVLEGIGARVVLPESKIGVLDNMSVSSTLSFLGKSVEEDMKDEEQERIQEHINKFTSDEKIDFTDARKMLNQTQQEELKSDASDSDEEFDNYNSLSFFKKTNNFIKKKPVENENLKFRLGTKSYSKSYAANNNVLTSSSERFNSKGGNQSKQKGGQTEVPFLGNKRQLEHVAAGFNRDYKRFKYSQTGWKKSHGR